MSPPETEYVTQDILTYLTDPVFLLKATGEILYANASGERLCRSRKLQGIRTVEDLFFQEEFYEKFMALLRSGQEFTIYEQVGACFLSVSERFNCFQSEVILFEGKVYEASKGIYFIRLFMRPELDQAFQEEHSLASVQKQVAALSAMLAHEVKNPLAGIKGAAQYLQKYIAEERKDFLDVIVSEADRLAALVNQFEQFSETRQSEKQLLNIHEVLTYALKIFETRESVQKKNILRSCIFDPSLPEIEGNFDQLVQVFLNLFLNAEEAMGHELSHHSVLTVRTKYVYGFRYHPKMFPTAIETPIVIEVEDTGSGIATEIQSQLFNPFVTTKENGTGLGLPLVAKILNDHLGQIRLKPNHTHGTCFQIGLPIGQKEK